MFCADLLAPTGLSPDRLGFSLLDEEPTQHDLPFGPVGHDGDQLEWRLLPEVPHDAFTVGMVWKPVASRAHEYEGWTRRPATARMVDVDDHACVCPF